MYLADSVGQQGHGPRPHQQCQQHLKVPRLQQEDSQRLLCWGALQQRQQQIQRTHHLGTQRLTLIAPSPKARNMVHAPLSLPIACIYSLEFILLLIGIVIWYFTITEVIFFNLQFSISDVQTNRVSESE